MNSTVYVAIDRDGTECCSNSGLRMRVSDGKWVAFSHHATYTPMKEFWSKRRVVSLPKGTIEKLIGKKLTWEDAPIEIIEV